MTQTATANHLLYLNDNERDSGGTELACHNHWERRMRATRLHRKVTFQWGHWENWTMTKQHHRFFLCPALLYIRNSPRSELHKTAFQLVLHPFWLDVWTFHSAAKDLVLALWKSICVYGRQCRFATSMPIHIIGAAISLARLPLKVLLCYWSCICTEQLYKKDHSSWKWQNQIMTLL